MKKIIFWELVLILATVPIFRALWILLDKADWLSEPMGVSISFVAGVILAIFALIKINSK
jgi:hypothetical protein